MAKHKAQLQLIHKGSEKQINVLIHGYNAVKNQKQYDSFCKNVVKAQLPGRVYIYNWQSGKLLSPQKYSWLVRSFRIGYKIGLYGWRGSKIFRSLSPTVLLDLGLHIGHFKYFEKRAKKIWQ